MGKTSTDKAVKQDVTSRKRRSIKESDDEQPAIPKRGRPTRSSNATKVTKEEVKVVEPTKKQTKNKPKPVESPIAEEENENSNNEVELIENKPSKKKATKGKQAVEEEVESEEVPTKPIPNKRAARGKRADSPFVEEETETSDKKVVPTATKETKKKATKAKPEEIPVVEEEIKTSDKEVESPKKRTTKGKQEDSPNDEQMETLETEVEPNKNKQNKNKTTRGRPAKLPVEKEDDETSEKEVEQTKSKRKSRGKAVKSPVAEDDKESSDKEVSTKAQPKTSTEKKTAGDSEIVDLSPLKIVSWNVGGIRAIVKKDALAPIVDLNADIICMQEVRCSDADLPPALQNAGDAYPHKYYIDSSSKKGYAGCATWCKAKPIDMQLGIGDDEMDVEGRAITLEFDAFYVVNVYVPNAGRKLVTLDKRMRWNALFAKFCMDLDKRKPVIITGDMNVAHNEIDLARPKANVRNAGFTQEERDGLTEFLELGFVDTFRRLHPEAVEYSFWAYFGNSRAKNIGWRLDYFFVSKRLAEKVKDSSISSSIMGSDHCPVVLQF